MRYIFRKLWHLIALLLVSAAAVLLRCTRWTLYPFLYQYFRFACFVIAQGVIAHFAGEAIPRRFRFDEKPFAPYKWEKNGRVYQEKLKIRSWKNLMMDMGKAGIGTASREIGERPSAEHLYNLLQETCVAEVTHVFLMITGLLLLVIIELPWSVLWSVVYILFNLTDVVIQRYNRPRLYGIYKSALRSMK